MAALLHPVSSGLRAPDPRLRRRVGVPAIVSIHSFTPILQRGWRPWQAAVLWDEDDRLAAPCSMPAP